MNINSTKKVVHKQQRWTPKQIDELMEKGVYLNFELPFGDVNKLTKMLYLLCQTKFGFKALLERRNKVIDKSYEVFMNPDTMPEQRERCLYDIARYEMIPHCLIKMRGNEEVSEALKTWKPVFGRDWFFKAVQEISNSDMINMFWKDEAERIYKQELERQKPLRTKDITMEIFNNDFLKYHYKDEANVIPFEELDMFWDKKSKCPNTLAHILIDLSLDLDGCLKENNKYHKTFGVQADANKQLSKLCKALDKLFPVDGVGRATDRWFLETQARDKTWSPRFTMISQHDEKQKGLIRKVIDKEITLPKFAEKYSENEMGHEWDNNKDGRDKMSFEVARERKLFTDK